MSSPSTGKYTISCWANANGELAQAYSAYLDLLATNPPSITLRRAVRALNAAQPPDAPRQLFFSPTDRVDLLDAAVTTMSTAGDVVLISCPFGGEVRVFYLAYAGTVSHDKLKRLASQGGAAALFSGNAPQGGLAEHVGADQGALAQITQKLGTATIGQYLSANQGHINLHSCDHIKRRRNWL
jgi:hypothetical protein